MENWPLVGISQLLKEVRTTFSSFASQQQNKMGAKVTVMPKLMTRTTGVLQRMAINSSEGIGKEEEAMG